MRMHKTIGFISALFLLLTIHTAVYAEELSIDSSSALIAFRDAVNSGNSYAGTTVTLTADIDLSGEVWVPIGTEETPFAGTFDGNGKSITGLSIYLSAKDWENLPYTLNDSGNKGMFVAAATNSAAPDSKQYSGLFGYNTGTIQNLSVATSDIGVNVFHNATHNYAAIIVGYNTGNITNCSSAGTLLMGNERSYAIGGGVCGYNAGTITGGTNSATIKVRNDSSWQYLYADAYAGGICGVNAGTVIDAAVDASTYIYTYTQFASCASGTVVGDNRGGIVSGCTGRGTTDALIKFSTSISYAYSGGIAGSNTGTIADSTAENVVVLSWEEAWGDLARYIHVDAGGVAGYNYGTVERCSVTGTVKAGIHDNSLGNAYAGGAVGYNMGSILDTDTNVTIEKTQYYTEKNISPDYIGGIVGYNEDGLIQGCAAEGTLQAYSQTTSSEYTEYRPKWIGGIVGYNEDGYVAMCSSSTEIYLDAVEYFCAGGLVAENTGVIENCYYKGSRMRAGTIGGMAGINSGSLVNSYVVFTSMPSTALQRDGITPVNTGTVSNCFYYNISVKETIEGTKKTQAELKTKETYANWAFDAFWTLDSDENSGYPVLLDTVGSMEFSGGNGTAASPYLITNALELSQMRYAPAAHYRLMKDITLTEAWTPVGNNKLNAFTGTLDGNGYAVKNFATNGEGIVYNGLIGYGDGCTIKNLTVETGETGITATNTQTQTSIYVAGILAFGRDVEIENCVFNGAISGDAVRIFAGGIAGDVTGSITGCRASGTITVSAAGDYTGCAVGAIVGKAEGTISGCFADAAIAASSDSADGYPTEATGGIAGRMQGDIYDSCFAGTFAEPTQNTNVYHGGVAGSVIGNIWNCYTDYAMSDGVMNYGPVTAELFQGNAGSVFYNADTAASGEIGTGKTAADFVSADFLTARQNDAEEPTYIWVKSAQTEAAEPLHVEIDWVIENGFTKCAMYANTKDAEIYFTRDGSDPRENGMLYAGPFLCDPMAQIRYCVKSGDVTSESMSLVANPQSKYPVQIVTIPTDQNGQAVSAETITQTQSMTVELLSEMTEEKAIFLAVYNDNEKLTAASKITHTFTLGENNVTFENLQITEGTQIRIFIWDGNTMVPCTEAIRI